MNGVVVTSRPDKGYFFVQPDDGTRDDNHFAHIRDWGAVLAVGERISFESRRSERGLLAVPGVQA
jgi:cold shock CspA family protein